ncbi:hypothetical protein FGE05_23375 [Pseudomonas sp. ICMP22404]|nr:hypothetical protein FGE05_23375 [Pseudomonas sp. ICMP22404]
MIIFILVSGSDARHAASRPPTSRRSAAQKTRGIIVQIHKSRCVHRRSTVGASLLAIASVQSTLMWTDTALSRAGSLPQGYVAGLSVCGSSWMPRYNASIPSNRSGSTPLSSAMRSMR